MEQQDKTIGRLYKETYSGVHADSEFKESVRTMTNKSKSRSKKIIRTVCIATALVVLAAAGGIIASASRGTYKTVIVNGEEKQARFGDYGNNVRVWCYQGDGSDYWVYVYGDFDAEHDTLYFEDYGDYFLASTQPDPTANLYTDISRSSNARIEEQDGEKYLYVTDDSGTQTFTLAGDAADGEEDGIFKNSDLFDTYEVLPNGSIINTSKAKSSFSLFGWNGSFATNVNTGETIDGSDWWNNFWGSFGNNA